MTQQDVAAWRSSRTALTQCGTTPRSRHRSSDDSHIMPRNSDTEETSRTENEQTTTEDSTRSLEDLVRGYLDARGNDTVAQLKVPEDGLEGGLLTVTAHTPVQSELPDTVTETDVVTVNGYEYELRFVEDPSGPGDLGSITLYAADSISGMDSVSLEDGLAAVNEHMAELIDSDEAPPSRTLG